jgi:hypothetical protein
MTPGPIWGGDLMSIKAPATFLSLGFPLHAYRFQLFAA